MKILRTLYINNRFFIGTSVIILLFIATFILDTPVLFPKVMLVIFSGVGLTDLFLLYWTRKGINGHRFAPDRLSNGDDNEIRIYLENFYAFPVRVRVIDEIPHQFQRRDISFYATLSAGRGKTIVYQLRPFKRGEYSFGSVNVFVSTQLGFLSRRFKFSSDKMVPVYPSYIQMRKYELMAISNRLTDVGIKKIRKIGHNLEFELIKEYVRGDDVRTINWKATARRAQLMVNHYQDERSQQVYSLIDKGRAMKMPFEGMSLLDYAINASLVISNIAIKKSDKAGLLTFQDRIGVLLPPSRSSNQMGKILEVLYKQKTAYRESDLSVVHNVVRHKITQRSLLLLYTNFESMYSLQRQIGYLKGIAKMHLLVVIFFQNTEVNKFLAEPASDLREVYQKAIAEKMVYEKRLIVKALMQHGIQAVLTTPQNLTVDTINKYLELKARGLI